MLRSSGLLRRHAAPYGMVILAVAVITVVGITSQLRHVGRAAALPGDVNADGVIDVVDLSLLLSHWGAIYPSADFNTDGQVNIFDLSYLLSRWGSAPASSSPTPTPTAPTPTPSPSGTPLPTTRTITWQGYTWEVRDNAWNTGAPEFNNNWSINNVVRGVTETDPLKIRISNPTGNSPYAAQLATTTSLGYGTYTLNAAGNFDTMDPSIVFGSIFTFDPVTTGNPGYNEIDVGEVSRWGNINNAYPSQAVKQTYYTKANKQMAMAGSGFPWPAGLRNATFQVVWQPGSLVFTIYKGNSTSTADILVRNSSTTDVPVHAAEKLYINAWVYQYSNTGAPASSANVPLTEFTLNSFTHVP